MASIFKRQYPSGKVVYRLIFRNKGFPIFCLTFEELSKAAAFAEVHEKMFRQNPEGYFLWRENRYYLMKGKGLASMDGMIIPKIMIKNRNNDRGSIDTNK